MVRVIRCHRRNMKNNMINGSKVSRLSVAIHTPTGAELSPVIACKWPDKQNRRRFNMTCQKIIYEQLKDHLYSLYSITRGNCYSLQACNLLNFRAISLTLFHTVINQYRSRYANYAGLTDSEIISHLLYEETGEIIPNLNQISLSLAIKILESRLVDALSNTDPELQMSYEKMYEHFEKLLQGDPQAYAKMPVLRELKWGDLPNELFSLTPGS